MGNTPMSISTFDHGRNPCVERGEDGQLKYVGPAEPADRMGGVGIVFVKDRRSELYVNLLMKGGPAHLSMQVQQGDRLRSVDGRPAGSMDLDVLQEIAGLEGTYVSLGFERSPSEFFVVDLVRSHACYPDELALAPPGYEFPSGYDFADPQEQALATASRTVGFNERLSEMAETGEAHVTLGQWAETERGPGESPYGAGGEEM